MDGKRKHGQNVHSMRFKKYFCMILAEKMVDTSNTQVVVINIIIIKLIITFNI